MAFKEQNGLCLFKIFEGVMPLMHCISKYKGNVHVDFDSFGSYVAQSRKNVVFR